MYNNLLAFAAPASKIHSTLAALRVDRESSEDLMKSNPAGPGGSLASKPTWSNASGVRPRRLFFFTDVVHDYPRTNSRSGWTSMTHKKALREANRRWGDEGTICYRTGLLTKGRRLFMVGKRVGELFQIHGQGQTWEEAFEKADRLEQQS
jgi:hypothetical protein